MYTVHLLCLAALCTSTLITCHPIQKETIQTDLTREKLSNMEAMINRYGYFLMTKLSKTIRKAIYQKSKGKLFIFCINRHVSTYFDCFNITGALLIHKGATLLKRRSKDCFSLLRIKKNKIMCLDTTKNVVDGINKDCFKTIHGKNYHHTLCPWRSDAMIKLVGAKSHTEAYSAELHHSVQSNHHKRHHRRRRSQHIDPSDPLGSENPRSRTANYRRPNREHERSSNVSKETITSCDDPLHVLLSKSPASPNLQKQKKNKQVAPSDPF
ncbi:Vacuolar membrane-associated protein IML1 [Labeo rohita]|uniref:Vacuolar membrane-associated protein IML1 n=1 Tax=Labeo rohita TaxID=84645 RepID=A0ABQ8LCG5_LABRO|nr:Vacuolar membrane-associated protein IML1 [Labeo rohita]